MPALTGRRGRRALLALLPLAALLAGCKLIDQSDFRPKPPPVVVPPAPPVPPPVPPLVAIRFDRPDIAYADALKQAVTAARRRKVDVAFDVQGFAPTAPSLAAQAASLQSVDAETHAVADAVAKLGVDPGRIRLSARTEAGIAMNEVRVYVH